MRALVVTAFGGLLAFAQLWPPPDGHQTRLFHLFGPGNLARAISLAFVPFDVGAVGLALGVPILVFVLLSLLSKPHALLATSLALLGLTYIYVFKHGGFIRHFGFLLLVVLMGLWLAEGETPSRALVDRWRLLPSEARQGSFRRAAFTLLGVSLTLSVGMTAFTAPREITRHFAEGSLMARYIAEQGLERRTIAAHPPGWPTAVLPYFSDLRFYYPGLGHTGTHMKWDRAFLDGIEMGDREAVARIKQAYPDWRDPERGVLIVWGRGRLDRAEELGYRLIHSTPGDIYEWEHKDEQLHLYAPAP
jgi:hypothetical protein